MTSSIARSSDPTNSSPSPVRCSSYYARAASTSAAASTRKRIRTLQGPLQTLPYLFPGQVLRIRIGESLLKNV